MLIGHIVSVIQQTQFCNDSNSTDDIMTSLLPDDAQGEIPVGFAVVGHIGKSFQERR
jgi:hypothetical protein